MSSGNSSGNNSNGSVGGTAAPPFFSMGPHTFQVSVPAMFGANREKLVRALLPLLLPEAEAAAGAAGAAAARSTKSTIFLRGGESATRFDSDHEPIFRQESYFWWLCGVKEPDCALSMCIIIVPTTSAATAGADVMYDDSGSSSSSSSTTTTTTLYVPRLPADYATIMGKIRTISEWKELYQVDCVKYTDEIEASLLHSNSDNNNSDLVETTRLEHGHHTNGGSSGVAAVANHHHHNRLLLMKGPNSDSGKMYEPPSDILANPKLKEYYNNNNNNATGMDCDTLFPVLAECRVIKSQAEQQLLRFVTEVTSHAHAYVLRNFKEGMYEYQAEALFRHYCHYNYGARLVGYTPICGCGPDAAVLHYGHAGEPNARQQQQSTESSNGGMGSRSSDICLFDMGAEYYCYGSDVTCSFPASGVFGDKERTIYEAVYQAQVAVYRMMRPGVSWVDCHIAAEITICEALVAAGLVVLAPPPADSFAAAAAAPPRTVRQLVVDMRLIGAVFMPHGLGHLIGVDTHDVGGYLPGHPPRIHQPGLEKLRTARVLQEGMVLTVEPGCYFIDHLLDAATNTNNNNNNDADASSASELRPYLNVDKINEYRGFGGVRLEDVVQVTATGVVNYTLCPRTVNEVESVMRGEKWPPVRDEAPELYRVRLTDTTPLPSPPSM